MKTPLFFACHPTRKVFDVGPYPSREDAVNEAPELMGLKPGEIFEVGEMRPFVPAVQNAHIHNCRRVHDEGHEGNPGANKWLQQMRAVSAEAREELQAALDLVLLGWMTKHDVLPAFGHVVNVGRAAK